VALDGRADSAGALAEAAALAGDARGLLVAMNVSPSRLRTSRRGRAALDEGVNAMVARCPDDVERVTLRGRPAAALAHASHDLDLLVVGCRAHRVTRSVSRELVASSASPLVVVPEALS
jgi:hypothetical protein